MKTQGEDGPLQAGARPRRKQPRGHFDLRRLVPRAENTSLLSQPPGLWYCTAVYPTMLDYITYAAKSASPAPLQPPELG